MIEPMIAENVARRGPHDYQVAVAVTDWSAYGSCSQVCRAKSGEPCVAMNGRVAGGRPDGVRHNLTVPHASRKRLKRPRAR